MRIEIEIDTKFIHKHYQNISCVILAESARGWKVRQMETFVNSRKKPKVKIQFYDHVDFDKEKGLWDAITIQH